MPADTTQTQPPPRKPHRRRFPGVLAVLGIGAMAAHGGLWWLAASQSRAFVDNWISAQKRLGRDAGYASMETSGFPGDIRLTLNGPWLAGDHSRWSGERLVLSAPPYSIGKIKFDLSGRHTGRLPLNGGVHDISLSAERLTGFVTLRNGLADTGSLTGSALELVRLDGLETVRLRDGHVFLERGAGGSTGWRVRLGGLDIPQSLRPPLGPRIRHLNARGRLVGGLSGNGLAEILTGWRDGGGRLDVTSMDVGYPPLRLTAGGTLRLDGDLQPAAAFNTRAEGLLDTVDALIGAGLIKNRDGLLAKLALAALSRTPADGGPRYLELPLTLRGRLLSLGPLDVARLKRIRW